MTVKSNVSDTPCKKVALPYPKLMKNQVGAVFFCPDAYSSLKLSSTVCPPLDLGRYESRCYSDQHNWVDYEGSICLENEKE